MCLFIHNFCNSFAYSSTYVKNLVNFLGKPLLQWSIEAALNSKYITDVVVSSDDDDILRISQKHKNVIPIKRPKELALDTSRTEPVLAHVIESLKGNKTIIIISHNEGIREFCDEIFNFLAIIGWICPKTPNFLPDLKHRVALQ